MLEYDRIDVSEGIDVNNINYSRECINCHSGTFSRYILDFRQTYVIVDII